MAPVNKTFHGPKLGTAIPDSISIAEFVLEEGYNRQPYATSRNPLTCGLSDRSYSVSSMRERVNLLARALAKELGWHPNEDTEFHKVASIYSVNAIDVPIVAYAVHLLSGLVTPSSAACSESEVTHQLISSGAKCIFTCASLLPVALAAAGNAQIKREHVYLLEIPTSSTSPQQPPSAVQIQTIDDLIREGATLRAVERLKWSPGQASRQVAYLCFSSGTSGPPKAVKISHFNVIANVLAITQHESSFRLPGQVKTCLGVLPQSHIYGIVLITHASIFRGDEVVILPRYDFSQMLSAIVKHQINTLFLVPPIILAFLANEGLVRTHDLRSMNDIVTGAAPLGADVYKRIAGLFPHASVREGYGLTETATSVATTKPDDIWLGSVGPLLPTVECRLLDPEGDVIQTYGKSGELWVKSPSVTLGYYNNDRATSESFKNGWHRTGDEAMFRVAPSGHEHLFIVDRIKELIKVKGNQVAPAELEAHLLQHPAVADAAVIPVHDPAAGEVPKAIVVKAAGNNSGQTDAELAMTLMKHISDHKSKYKWLRGGLEFVPEIPKSASGKIMRRLLRNKERERSSVSLPKI
ncbi:hypothetical protein BJY01DRAFT_259599 [Aspergillus pseudoustus]|uniref:Uncharacterized protein n=1 Tax=Aspergillus pseudoustus TaxID=1810923 RepID=A0ABR4J2P1_9EURO